MTRNTKRYFAAVLCMVVFCSIMGIVTRNSYGGYTDFREMEESENLQEFSVQVDDGDYAYYVRKGVMASVKDYSDLEKVSDVIAKVSATDDRILFTQSTTKTKLIVEEVYKGELEKGQTVFLYELAEFSYSVVKHYNSGYGYQLMDAGEEYYVFLRGLQTGEGYRMSEEEKITFLPSTALYSKFPVKEGEISLLDGDKLHDGGYTYGEVRNEEILTSEQKVLETYKKIKREVMGRFSDTGEKQPEM